MANPKRSGLGRGIGALIPTVDEHRSSTRPSDVFFTEQDNQLRSVPGAKLANLSPSDIFPNPKQPRMEFDPDDLAELIQSIREVGVLQPIVVRLLPVKNGQSEQYELVMGERRLRASKHLGLESIPAVIKDTADENMLRDALLENLHRAQLNPLEEASAYQQLLDDFDITHEELATRIGRSRPQITNTIRLLKLPTIVQKRVAAGVLSSGHARAILSVGDVDQMIALSEKIVNQDLSVRAAETAASAISPSRSTRVNAGRRNDHLTEVAERLADKLNTRVRVNLTKTKGQIVIEFATIEDLSRILLELGDKEYGK